MDLDKCEGIDQKKTNQINHYQYQNIYTYRVYAIVLCKINVRANY